MIRTYSLFSTLTRVILSLGFVLSLFLLPNSLVLAGNGKLTNKKAHAAISEWLHGAAKEVKVTGILEIPQQNSAEVDLTIQDWLRKRPMNDAVTAYAMGPGGGTYLWSGQAKAVFVHYNDGKWVLKSIIADTSIWNDLNITVSP